MDNKEQIKIFMRKTFPEKFSTEAELDDFAEKLLENAEKIDTAVSKRGNKVWKKEEIERLGIKVTPVKWKKLD